VLLRGLVCIAALIVVACEREDAPVRKPDVWYVPTTPEMVDRMLRLANVQPNDVVYDLGCGDGRIVIAAARDFGARAVGIDIDPKLIRVARANAAAAGVADRVRFEVGDLFEADLREATVVTLYLLPHINRRLRPKLLAQLPPGARIVAHDFDLGDEWPPDETLDFGRDILFLGLPGKVWVDLCDFRAAAAYR
jgi:cyclopropane fatty-acyl-phospholipid synthase-like methyltransferase